MNEITDAIKRLGGLSRVADAMQVKPPSLHRWKARGIIPPARAARFSEITGIPLHRLNPSVFPAPENAA